MLRCPEVKTALFWYRNKGGPVMAIEKVPIPVPSAERSQAANVYRSLLQAKHCCDNRFRRVVLHAIRGTVIY
jgi:hypothetical protein